MTSGGPENHVKKTLVRFDVSCFCLVFGVERTSLCLCLRLECLITSYSLIEERALLDKALLFRC